MKVSWLQMYGVQGHRSRLICPTGLTGRFDGGIAMDECVPPLCWHPVCRFAPVKFCEIR
jgi:hypothetical protein